MDNQERCQRCAGTGKVTQTNRFQTAGDECWICEGTGVPVYRCPTEGCESSDLVKQGFRVVKGGRKQRILCNNCGCTFYPPDVEVE